MKTITITKEVEVPSSLFTEVADLILDSELAHRITAACREADSVTLEISYTKDERQAMHQIEDLINDHEDDVDDDTDDEE